MENEEKSEKDKAEILALARRALRSTELLIQACDNWLPAEVGNKEMSRRFRERERVKTRRSLRRFLKFFGIKLKETEVEKQYYRMVDGEIIDLMYSNYPPYDGKQDIAGIAGYKDNDIR